MSIDPPIKPTLEVSTSAKATVANAAPVWGAPRRPTSVASGCLACQTPSAPSDHGGALHFAHPLGHTLGKLRRTLAARFQLVPSPVGAFAALVPAGALREVAEAASEALNAAERASCKVLFEADSKESAREERTQLERVVTLEGLLGQLGSSWLVSMLAEDRFYSAFQPIVAAANLFEPFAYECLLRGVAEDGSTVYPDAIFSTARAAGLLFQVDRAARLSAIRCASAQGLGTPLFINFNPTAIYDPKFCLKATTDAIHKAGIAPERIVFEIVESDQVGSLEHLLNIVSYYRERGFRVALDDLGSGYSSLTMLAKLKPDFVKFDRGSSKG